MSSTHPQWTLSHASKHSISLPRTPPPHLYNLPPPSHPNQRATSSNTTMWTVSPSTESPRAWCQPSGSGRSSISPLSWPSKTALGVWRRGLGITLTYLIGAQRGTKQTTTTPGSRSQQATASVGRSSGLSGSTPRPSPATPPRTGPVPPPTSSRSTLSPSLQPIQWNLYQPGSATPLLAPLQPSIPSKKPPMSSMTRGSRPILTATMLSKTPSASPWLRPRNTRPTLIGITSLRGYAKPSWKQRVPLPVLHIWKGSC